MKALILTTTYGAYDSSQTSVYAVFLVPNDVTGAILDAEYLKWALKRVIRKRRTACDVSFIDWLCDVRKLKQLKYEEYAR